MGKDRGFFPHSPWHPVLVLRRACGSGESGATRRALYRRWVGSVRGEPQLSVPLTSVRRTHRGKMCAALRSVSIPVFRVESVGNPFRRCRPAANRTSCSSAMPHIEVLFRVVRAEPVQAGSIGHRRNDRYDLGVGIGQFHQRVSKYFRTLVSGNTLRGPRSLLLAVGTPAHPAVNSVTHGFPRRASSIKGVNM